MVRPRGLLSFSPGLIDWAGRGPFALLTPNHVVTLRCMVSAMLYERFSDEAAFRQDFVRPLLTRLGYFGIAELHGTQEFGKDFVFSEQTPFGFPRHYAAVVKHEKSIGQGAHGSISEIMRQVSEAFAVQFRLPDHEEQHRVSAVFVFNSGRIAIGAQMSIRSQISEEKYGRNVHVLDGERLFQLDLTATTRRGELFLPQLNGLDRELWLNTRVWTSILEGLPSFTEHRGSFTRALEGFLTAPFVDEHRLLESMMILLQESRIIDSYNWLGRAPFDQKELLIVKLRETLERALQRAQSVRDALKDVQKRFAPLSAR